MISTSVPIMPAASTSVIKVVMEIMACTSPLLSSAPPGEVYRTVADPALPKFHRVWNAPGWGAAKGQQTPATGV